MKINRQLHFGWSVHTVLLVLISLILSTIGESARARDRAVLLGTSREANVVGPASTALYQSGFDVVSGSGLSVNELSNFARLMLEDRAEGRRIILLEGVFIHDNSESWILGLGAAPQDRVDLAAEGLSLSLVMNHLSQKPGGALLILVEHPTALSVPGMNHGFKLRDIPQGVTVVHGPPKAVVRLITEELVVRGASLAAMVNSIPEITAIGFVAPLVPFRPEHNQDPATQANTKANLFAANTATSAAQYAQSGADTATWNMAKTLDDAAAYKAYLSKYPQGEHSKNAKIRLDQLRAETLLDAATAESLIGLSRQQRLDLQRALNHLGYPTGPLDGVFGKNSRSALRDWQTAQGLDATGFLTHQQTLLILETAVLMPSDEAQIPANLLAPVEATSNVETPKPAQASALAEPLVVPVELAYLQRYSDGLFAEAALALGADRRRAINIRLMALGLMTGPISDDLTEDSRVALKLFQQAQGLTIDGYANQKTWQALFADDMPEAAQDTNVKNAQGG